MILQDSDQLILQRVCKNCAKKGCEKCQNKGYNEIRISLTDLYDSLCTKLEYRYAIEYNQAFLRDTM